MLTGPIQPVLQKQKPAKHLLKWQLIARAECCTNTPVEAVVRVVRQYERWHNQTTRHGAHLLTQPLHILTDSLIPAQQAHHKTHHSHCHGQCLHRHWWLTGCPLPPWAHWQYNKLDPGNRRRGGSRSAFSSSSHTSDYRWTDPGFLTGKREGRQQWQKDGDHENAE